MGDHDGDTQRVLRVGQLRGLGRDPRVRARDMPQRVEQGIKLIEGADDHRAVGSQLWSEHLGGQRRRVECG